MKDIQLSVVICTYNRCKWIRKALESCKNQTLAYDNYEVIVVNNNCSDSTESIVNDFISNNPNCSIRQVQEFKQGLSYARNRGISESNSELILYMDDDGVANKDLFEKVVNYMNRNLLVVGLGGKVVPIYEGKEPKWLNKYLIMMVTAIDYGDKEMQCKGKKYPPGCNMTYRKDVLVKRAKIRNFISLIISINKCYLIILKSIFS